MKDVKAIYRHTLKLRTITHSYLQAKINNNELVKFTTSNTSKAGAGTGKAKKDKDNEPATNENAGPINRKATPKII